MVSLAAQERRFALALLAPALVVLLLTTTAPLVYLAWNSLQRLDLAMPWLSGFAGVGNYAKMGSDPRFWNSLVLTGIYTASTVVLQVVIGLVARAARSADPARARRPARRGDPAHRARAGRGRPLLAHARARTRFRPGRPRHPRAGARQPQLARRPAARADLGHRHPYVAVDAVRVPGASRRRSRRFRPTSTKPRGSTAPVRGSASGTSRCR